MMALWCEGNQEEDQERLLQQPGQAKCEDGASFLKYLRHVACEGTVAGILVIKIRAGGIQSMCRAFRSFLESTTTEHTLTVVAV